MKKFFALVLAVAMIMSMAAVSFAATDRLAISKAGDYSADKNTFTEGGKLEYGDTVYFKLTEKGAAIKEYKFVEKLKLKVKYELGENLVDSVSIVKKNEGGEYVYFVAVKTTSKVTTGDADIIGTFTFNRKADKADKIEKIDDEELNFEINLFYDNVWYAFDTAGSYGTTIYNVESDNEVNLKWGNNYVLKFSYDDEVEFTFGASKDDNNEGTFTVDVSGQGKTYVKYNTTANEAIVAANPGVEMKFVNFNGAKFNRTGEFAYEMEDGVACYKVVGDKLVAIPGAEYDEADETFYFNTRVLESYVFASAELVNPVVEAPVVEAPVAAPSNPSTGA